MRFTSSFITALFILASTAVPGLAAPLPRHISSLVPHPDTLSPRALNLRSVVSLLIPRDAEEVHDIEAREPCMRGAPRSSAPRLVPREGNKRKDRGDDVEAKRLKLLKKEGRRRPTIVPGVTYGRSRLTDKVSVWVPKPKIET